MNRRKRMLQDLDQEIREHIDIATRENIDRGMSPEQARYAALRKFGNVTLAKEDTREVWSLLWLEQLLQDVRFGLRVLAKSPGFTAIAALTLALGIGATTAIFSVVYGVLLSPLPYRNPEQIVRLWEQNNTGGRMNFADANFADLRAQAHSLSALALYHNGIATVTGHGEPTRTATASVSRDFFSVMSVQPVLGRAFAPDEQRPKAPTVALVSYAYWKQTLGSIADLSSIRLNIDSQPASVIGVLPPGFRFPDNSDIWISSELSAPLPSRSAHNDRLIGRLRDGISLPQARAELTSIAQKLKQQYGEDTAMVAVAVDPLREAMTNDVRPAFILLLSASGFLLLIACANVVNLMLAHAAGREKELSMRAALGAQRSRLIRQFLTESLLLSLLGGALGILLAYWGLNGLLALAPNDLPRLENVSMNSAVLLFSLGIVLLVSLGMGLFTALRSISRDAHTSLNEGIRAGTGNLSKQRIGRLIAAGQLAMALVLLVGATLLGRSLLRVLSMNPGFRTQEIVTMDLALPYDADMTSRVEFLSGLLAKLSDIPGVTQVGGISDLPLAGSGYSDGYYLPMNAGEISAHMQDLFERSATASIDKDPALFTELSSLFDQLFRDKSHLGDADFVVASGGYFKSLDIPLLQGRAFDDRDTADSPPVALISQSLANEKWPNEDPIGHTLEFGNMDGDARLLTIVGVVGDVRDHSLEAVPFPTVYVDYRQRPRKTWSFAFVMRTSNKPDAVFAAARGILHDLDPTIPPHFRTFPQVYSASVGARQFSVTLVAIFSLVALLLALAGIYGVFSYFVAQRTREIGVRMALGATTPKVVGMILQQGTFTAAIGIVAGLLGSFAVSRWLQSQLFELSPTDPSTLLGVSLLLVLISLVACCVPALRASRIDPVIALRCE